MTFELSIDYRACFVFIVYIEQINANWFFKCEWYGIMMIMKRWYIEFLVFYIVDIISTSFLYSWYFINRFSFVYSWYFINRFGFFRFIVNSLVFTCSKWTMKTIQNLWYLFKINNINIKNININININSSLWPYSNVSINDFEQILDHDLVFLSPTLGS